MPEHADQQKAPTGVKGLDEILEGGLPVGQMHLVQGGAGTGKTTLGLQFLAEGVRRGERALFITLAQTEAALRKIAQSYGLSFNGVDMVELAGMGLKDAPEQTLFRTADVELEEATTAILDAIEQFAPDRIVLDSVAQLRLLADVPLRYQRQLLALRAAFSKGDATVLVIDSTQDTGEQPLAELSHGVILLDRSVPDYGNVRRRLVVEKMRGMHFHGGNHNFRIQSSGLDVFPRLEPQDNPQPSKKVEIKSGVAGIDTMLGGGLNGGTACLVLGATGTGKSSLASLYIHAAAERGERAAIFLFDEQPETFLTRSEGLGMNLRGFVEQSLVTLKSISTAQLSPGEFSQMVRDAVDGGGANVVMMDSLTGYFHAMPQEDALASQMHDLLGFLSDRGVLSLLVVSQHGIVGDTIQGPLDVSYMSDTVILLRHFETGGMVRKAISVIKKRDGAHETTIREMRMGGGSIYVGEPIRDFTGVLSGRPVFRGHPGDMFE
ncbi:MAG: gas vesicle protein GvpD [Sphingobium sp.]|uniref:ATPase domain-containing protein n=1 Tax=Sphingobium sp. TaxID=1912891 RepID=UPI0029BAE0F4|nr:ATPase domain-containing protein [Sphingobium sp.]MDX3911131.1 gas vesicle protein GvpD [Sphingobium sp.]